MRATDALLIGKSLRSAEIDFSLTSNPQRVRGGRVYTK